MSIIKKVAKDVAKQAGNLAGNESSHNAQNATDSIIDGMNQFKFAAERKSNVPFEQAKGNLFEYIEAAKFNKEAANNGSILKAVVTESVGRPHDPADIEIVNKEKVVRQVQAKFSDSKHAASDSVNMQRSDKYKGMQRLIRKDDSMYEGTSLLDKAKSLAENRASRQGSIYREQYQDVLDNITDELNYDDISSGGTTLEELRRAYDSPQKYARALEHKQVAIEMKQTATNMAAASMVTGGIVSGVSNLFALFNNDKELTEALKDIKADVVKNGIRGGTTGAVSTAIRYEGLKLDSALLSDSTASTVMAGAIIDGGVALYSYARGELSADELKDELIDTTAKATTTIYYTKAITAIMGKGVTPFVPMAVYTTASYVVACTREIIRNANLNAEEYNRIAAMYQESARVMNEAHKQFKTYIVKCENSQRKMLEGFISEFEYDIETGDNYEQAISAIVNFANQAGIALQDVQFEDFKTSMKTKDKFVLR